jgi:hypothetical protein
VAGIGAGEVENLRRKFGKKLTAVATVKSNASSFEAGLRNQVGFKICIH